MYCGGQLHGCGGCCLAPDFGLCRRRHKIPHLERFSPPQTLPLFRIGVVCFLFTLHSQMASAFSPFVECSSWRSCRRGGGEAYVTYGIHAYLYGPKARTKQSYFVSRGPACFGGLLLVRPGLLRETFSCPEQPGYRHSGDQTALTDRARRRYLTGRCAQKFGCTS